MIRFTLLAALAVAPALALAQEPPRDITPERPEVLNRVTACRAISGAAERLACFDREVAALEVAAASREIAVVNREEVRRARRSLFGLRLPDLGIFSDDDEREEDDAAIREISSTVTHFATGGDGRMTYALADGSVWVQTDGRRQRLSRGAAIKIRRGPLGSYIANIEERAGFRVIRQR